MKTIKIYRLASVFFAIILTFTIANRILAKTDDELRASNEIEFFVTEADGSWWNVTYPANGTIGNKYLNEVIEGVQLRGIRVDKVSDFRYQLIPATQEQINLLCGYETVDDATFSITGIRQRHKLQAFLRDVDSPTANTRIEAEKKQAEEKRQREQKQSTLEAAKTKLQTLSIDRWANIITSYLYDNNDNTFNVLDCDNKNITVSTYNTNDYMLIDTKNIPFELEKFGGFYSGKKYNYIVFGQNNTEESDSKEVIRIVKYDKNFNRLSQASVKNCYTNTPFDAGTLRMCENDNKMFIHTSRTRYLTDDGLHHQSQLTIILDTNKMAVENFLGDFQENHVSHSFNQFVIHDRDNFVLLDLGDAYPRSVVLNKYEGINPEEWLSEYYDRTVLKYTSINLFEIPGAVGANCTGVTVGGFEYSDNNYIVTINSIDHSKVTEYDSYKMTGLDLDERNIVLLVSSKHNTDTSKVKKIYLTDYVGKNKLGSTPYLVKLPNNRFIVLWEEYLYTDNKWIDNGMKYVQINGNGEIISDIRTRSDIYLSSDCQPVKIDNKLMWYADELDDRKFFDIDLNEALTTVTVNGKLVNFDQPPTIVDGRTLVPVRAIFEALGASVDWNGNTQTVTSTRGSTTVSLTINSKTMTKNGKNITLDVPAQMKNDRTLVPARAIAEAFGCTVEWDSDTQTVIIEE